MYMPDAVEAIIGLMTADASLLTHRNAYNITAMSVTPSDIAVEIRKHLPGFVMEYEVDPVRQAIADGWPRSLDDSAARVDWGWAPQYDLAAMTKDMLVRLRSSLAATKVARSRNGSQPNAHDKTDTLTGNEAWRA
jgi:nucleoside-diphosphate-sugar epimerase